MVQQQPKSKTRRVKTKHDADKIAIELVPRNERQGEYLAALKGNSQIVVFGPAGTGKTYCVSTFAANQYHMKFINKIVITRPHVAVGKDIGYLPGTLEEKCAPWALPVIDVLEEHLGKGVDLGGQQTSMVCGSNLSPGLRTLLPLMNTLLAVALQPIDVVQACPVLALSILSLDTAGMPVFMDSKNRRDYNLNLLNWPFFTSCLMPPTI